MCSEEIESFTKRFMTNGRISSIPRRERDRQTMRHFLASQFDGDAFYSEEEINFILAKLYSDYAYLRRDLIDCGIMSRTESGEPYYLSPDYVEQCVKTS